MRDSNGFVALVPWSDTDLPVLERSNTDEMKRFLGGPESSEKLAVRHARYLRGWQTDDAFMFKITTPDAPQGVGALGYWPTKWQDHAVYEAGWSVETAHQGRGIASAAVRACLEHAARHGVLPVLYAFPRTDNVGSNLLCERLGFSLEGEHGREYPKGNPIRVNAWSYQLREVRR